MVHLPFPCYEYFAAFIFLLLHIPTSSSLCSIIIGLTLQTKWKPHANAVLSLSYNTTRNHFISASDQEMIVWEDVGEVWDERRVKGKKTQRSKVKVKLPSGAS
jgi:hypothetical protein